MRILHLIPTFDGGGAERQLALLSRAHAEMGIETAIVHHGDGVNLDLLRNGGVGLSRIAIRNNHDPTAIYTIAKIIRSWKPDLVQTWLTQMDVLGGIAARLTGTPYILSERCSSWPMAMTGNPA